MPVWYALPYEWHNTPNLYMCTVADFDVFCTRKNLRVLNRLVMNGEHEQTLLPNLMGTLALYRLAKS